MELVVKGARVVDYSSDFIGDVYIKDGLIESIGSNLDMDCETVEGSGFVLLPSFVDLHAHFRDPGLTYKEDLNSGSMAAVRGGYTAVNLMANTRPVCDSKETVLYVKNKIREIGLIDVHQAVSVTKGMDGKNLSHLEELKGEISFISEDGKGVLGNEVMLLAMRKAKELNMGIMSHAEYEELNKYDTRLSENLMTIRDIELARFTGCHLHMCHVSTSEAMDKIIEAKDEGVNVTCEVTPHHIGLTGIGYRVNPPIRNNDDVSCLINAMRNGYVDAIATDHAPHTAEDKLGGSPGISGIETAFSVCYTKLVKENGVELKKLSEIMSKRPAELLGMNKGIIREGYDGDIVLVNLEAKQKIDSARFASKGKNTPFDGMEFYGEVVMTIKGGRIVYKREDYV